MNLALAADEAERQVRRSDELAGQLPRSASKQSRVSNDSARSANSGASSQQDNPTHSVRSGTQDNSLPRCYECGGIGHFGRECPTRIKRLGSSPNSPGRRNPSERAFETSKLTQREASERDYTARYERNTHEGKRVRGESGDSSLHLGVPENAVGKTNIAVLLEHGAPSITLEIEGKWRRLFVDAGSSVSILQPGVSRRDLRDTSLRPFGVTGKTLDVKGRELVSFTLGGQKFDHMFLVCPLPPSSWTDRHEFPRNDRCRD